MCGIVGYIGKKRALNIIIDGLEALEYRGYDSAGICYKQNNQLVIKKEEGRIKNLKGTLDLNCESSLGIGHTRWATHGKPTKNNAHPHQVGSITIVHNGIIENYLELKGELTKLGYKFSSDTDTEVACALIDHYYQKEKNIIKAIHNASLKMRGSYALGIICKEELDTLYCTRVTSPLIIAKGNNEVYIASDVPAILKYTNNYLLLDDYEIAALKLDQIKIYDQNLKLVEKETKQFEGTMDLAMKNGYDHFMLKEINEEPEIIKNTIHAYLDEDGNFKNLPDLKKYNNIHIVACGSAYHTGLVAKNLIENIAEIPVFCEIASEYRYEKVFYDSKTLVIVISQSGETADTLAALNKANKDGIDTLAIVNVVGSSIARNAKYVAYIKAGYEIAVATTKAYSAQVALLSLIAIKLGLEKGKITKEEFNNIKEEIELLPGLIQNTIDKNYEKFAKKIYMNSKIFFIGRGIDYALCMEGSLKLKEISYINSASYQAGELKHGTISLIENNTPVIAISTEQYLEEKTISNIKEVKSRGAYVLYITNHKIDGDFYDDIIEISKISKYFTPLLTVIPLQLIAYYVAKMNHCDIDKPRNLAKSVTVE